MEKHMPRNVEKDIYLEALRRKNILEAGLKLFSAQGIESVSMNTVAAEAKVGPTTLFKYFKTKEKLVITISGMIWKNIWEESLKQIGAEQFSKLTAYELIQNYTANMIQIYKNRPELLRFSGNYKTFICRQKTKAEDLQEHLNPLKPIQVLFHSAYQRAKTDHSIRTDVPEDIMFTSIAIGMLAIAERYAQGIVWANNGVEDHIRELEITREMILNWCIGNK